MINELAKRAISEQTVKKSLNSRMLISLNSVPLPPGCSNIHQRTPEQRYTDGWYSVKYKPTPTKIGRVKRYLIMCDLFHEKYKFLRVKDYDELVELSKKDPRVMWLFKYTNISKELFDIARKNVCVAMPFCLDVVKYNNEIKQKTKELAGTEPDYALLIDPLMALAERERVKAYFATRNKEIRNL